jgi:hypothetical protein
MARRRVTEVNPRRAGGWEEKDRGAERARRVYETKEQAVKEATQRARKDRGSRPPK